MASQSELQVLGGELLRKLTSGLTHTYEAMLPLSKPQHATCCVKSSIITIVRETQVRVTLSNHFTAREVSYDQKVTASSVGEDRDRNPDPPVLWKGEIGVRNSPAVPPRLTCSCCREIQQGPFEVNPAEMRA